MSTIEIVDVLLEFLEVTIHNILYMRKLYPEAIFAPRKKYGVLVYQSEHPLLNEYIKQVLEATKVHAQNNQLKQVLLYIKTNNQLVEKFIFDILLFENKPSSKDPLLVKLEQALRTFCVKLSNSVNDLKPLTSSSEFEIMLHTTEFSAAEFNEEQEEKNFQWLPVDPVKLHSLGIVPIHNIDSDKLVMQIYVEEYGDNESC